LTGGESTSDTNRELLEVYLRCLGRVLRDPEGRPGSIRVGDLAKELGGRRNPKSLGLALKVLGYRTKKVGGTKRIVLDPALLSVHVNTLGLSGLATDMGIVERLSPKAPSDSDKDNTQGHERESTTHVVEPSSGQLGVLASLPKPAGSPRTCEACGRTLPDPEAYFGRGGRVLCREDFGMTAAQEVPSRG